MSLITQHITDLLYTHDCVILPDFGAFLTQKQSAKINTRRHEIQAPKKTLRFSGQIKNHDGLLINSIAKAQHISFQKAEKQLDYFIDDLKSSLQQGEKVHLKNIGTFFQNESIEFTADPKTNFLLDAYGLESCTLTSMEIEEPVSIGPKNTSTVIPIETGKKSKNASAVYRYAAASLVAIGLISALGYTYYTSNTQQQMLVNEQKAQQIIESKIQTAEFSLSTSLEPIIIKAETSSPTNRSINSEQPFHVIAGAFKNQANARKLLSKLKAKGYKAQALEKNKYNLYPISYGGLSSRSKARDLLKRVRTTENKSAWLLVK